jgi:hypothetical protein
MSTTASPRIAQPEPTSEDEIHPRRPLKSVPDKAGSNSKAPSQDTAQGLSDEQLRYEIVGWDEA